MKNYKTILFFKKAIKYRTRAINRRSRLVAAPLSL